MTVTCVLIESQQLGLQSLIGILSQLDGGGALEIGLTHLNR